MPGSVLVYRALLDVELPHSIANATCSVFLVGVLRKRLCQSVRHAVLFGTAPQVSSRCMTRPGTVNLAIKCGLGFMIGCLRE